MRINVFKSGGNSAQGGFVSNGLTLQGPLILSGPHTEPLHAVPKQYVDNATYNLDANNITSGVLAAARLPAFTGDATTILGTSNLILANTGVTPGSIIKPTVDAKGRVVSGGTITEADITAISFDKVTTGRPTTLNGYGITDGVPLSSNTIITGDLIQSADPVSANHAATKQYVDTAAGIFVGISVGDIIRKPYTTTPAGFLKCNGGEVDKITYANLYSVIGDTFANDITKGSGKPWQYQYDFNTIQDSDLLGWTAGTSLPSVLTHSSHIVTKNRVYLLGGWNGTASVATVYTAPINSDGTLGTWTSSTSLPVAVHGSQAIVVNNRVHLISGITGSSPLSTVYTASINVDGTLGAWSVGTSLPGNVGWTKAIVTKNRVYTFGGWNGSSPISTIYTTTINDDGTLGSWSVHGTIPNAVYFHIVCVIKNYVYLLGGYNGSISYSSVHSAVINSDGTIGTWTSSVFLPKGVSAGDAIVTKNSIYVIFNTEVWSTKINSDGTIGTWTNKATIPYSMGDTKIVVTNSKIYLISSTGNGYVGNVYYTSFLGGMNDYSAYYDGTIEPVSLISTKFRLPDYTSLDKEFGEYVTSYIKY